MEPLIGGVTQVLVQQLYNSLANEHQTLHVFRDEFEKMKIKIGLMTSFLTDAQRLKGTDLNYTTVKAILAQVRDLVYDADDVVLDCQTRAAHENISILGGSTPRGLAFRYNKANALKDINIRIAEMENQLRTYLSPVKHMIQNRDEGSSQGSGSFSRRASHVLGPEKIIGLKEDTEKIIRYITRNENSSSIGIVGMGGLGKTTIARNVYNHKQVVDYFDIRIWVSVTQKFSPEDILTSMLKQLRIDNSVQDEMSQILQNLNNKKYLIVMDDVWDPDRDWWREISPYLPEGERNKKSIVVTTRNEDDAKKMEVTSIHHARELNGDDSWTLFSEVAFRMNKSKGEDPEFQEMGKVIGKKCNGLPLAIKTVAGLLASKVSLREWQDVRDNFHDVLATNTSVSVILQLSYDDLPAMLKHCILSFSIYPEDCEINAEQLTYWWVGEGFVRGKGKKTALEEASQCLSELVNRCLVGVVKQRGYDGRVYTCRMHDMVRGLIIKMSKETFSSFDVRNIQIPDLNSRHLGYTNGMEEKFMENNSKLRAFLLMEDCVLPSLHGTGLATIKCLRVLDLSQNEQESLNVDDLLRWLKYQKRLAYLNLRKLRGLIDLPNWIRKRQNLQILVIKECSSLNRLPSCITTLQNLIVLNVENCPLENLPQGLGKLTKLQVLFGFKLGSSGKDGARLRDLKGLKELRELGIQLSKKDAVLDETEDVLSELEQLKVLSIDTKDCGEKQVGFVEKLVPPPSLRELYLRSYQGKTTPAWVIPTILPELLYLYIGESAISRVNTDFWICNGKSWKIEALCFMQLPRLEMKWEDAEKNMKYLRYVEVSRCQGLQSFPIEDVNKHGIWVKEDFEHGFQNQEGNA